MFFKSKNEECFICCTMDGKTEKEILFEKMYNQKYMDYPLLSLSYVYNCKCINSFAHNKCLITIYKCPTCRKVGKPKLYCPTKYDVFFKFLFNWIKKDISRIDKINKYALCCLVFICVLLFSLHFNKEVVVKIITPKSWTSLFFSIVIGFLFSSSIYTLTILNDYFDKYWLYDFNAKKCYATEN